MNLLTQLGRTTQRVFNRTVIGAFAGGVIATLGVTAVAASEAVGGMHNMARLAADSSDPAAHMQLVLSHLYSAVNATDAQKAQIEPIVQQAMNDLKPYHDQLHGAHAQLLSLFTQSTIDRNAVETWRTQELQTVDQGSQRLMQMFEDVGAVLTPAQRQQLATHLQAMHRAKHG